MIDKKLEGKMSDRIHQWIDHSPNDDKCPVDLEQIVTVWWRDPAEGTSATNTHCAGVFNWAMVAKYCLRVPEAYAKRGRPPRHLMRNKSIFEAASDGVPIGDIARMHGLTKSHVGNMVRQHKSSHR